MIFKQVQIDKFLKRPDSSIKAVLIYGTNEGLVAEYVKSFVKSVCEDVNDPFRVAYLNGADVNADSGILFGEYGSQSLMGGQRVVVVSDVDNNLTKVIKSLFETTKSDTLLILYSGSLNKKSSLVKVGEDSEDIAVIPCYEDRDEDIFAAARAKFVEGGYTLGNDALQVLCSRLSNDRKSSMSEIDKLMTYVGDRKNITLDDVTKVISDNSASSGDDVCYYAASGQVAKALASYDKLLNEGNEPISIIRSVTYHFNKLLTCMGYMEQGETIDKALMKLTPLVIFFRKNTFKSQVSLWPKDKLFSVLELLYKCERDCKTTNMPVEEIASYTLMQIASAAAKLNRRGY